MLTSAVALLGSNRPGECTNGGDRPLVVPLSLTRLFGLDALTPLVPNPPTLPFLSALMVVVARVDLGLSTLGVSSPCDCVGVVELLSTRDFLADDRGVTLIPDSASPPEPSCCFTLGVTLGGSDLTVEGVLGPVDRTVGDAEPAIRGVSGVRAVPRGTARVGFKGRPVVFERSDMVGVCYRGGRDMEGEGTQRGDKALKHRIMSCPSDGMIEVVKAQASACIRVAD